MRVLLLRSSGPYSRLPALLPASPVCCGRCWVYEQLVGTPEQACLLGATRLNAEIGGEEGLLLVRLDELYLYAQERSTDFPVDSHTSRPSGTQLCLARSAASPTEPATHSVPSGPR